MKTSRVTRKANPAFKCVQPLPYVPPQPWPELIAPPAAVQAAAVLPVPACMPESNPRPNLPRAELIVALAPATCSVANEAQSIGGQFGQRAAR